ncbi:NADH dehydrogenase [ubiquinone] iron-sulfur protein 6, mitochondrial-like [Daphnia pulex]|uniref:EOG090X0NBY n=2 Tax=Daphnia pulex TaxID=6669 RepID=A0A4Y7MX61_DAPPU|nr:NADH dehydrogenase [ubiquinone] iron-sulfur protein 6, mitochondrial-like [Daphnia pulex]XP_046635447.1 NADH dehydrogenase [ubiquinone] iron-sulfur protein 6, mitochondrial-like [Daphnia pulicaria]CAG4640581.1 EOG090X0NBY [Daphnia pulex]SVE85300.1 EOG090X0NBY [Daphnia pulex]
MSIRSTIAMATSKFRLVQILGKQLKQTPIRHEIPFSTAPKVLKEAAAADLPTHTGQKWDESDFRLARFENASKQVNTRFAIDLIAQVPPKETKSRIVSCNGGGGPLGHPQVYINLDKPGNHTCGYCGLRFVKPDDHHH